MKKVFLVLAVVALVLVSCKKSNEVSTETPVDSTEVQVDSVSVDSTALDTTNVDVVKKDSTK